MHIGTIIVIVLLCVLVGYIIYLFNRIAKASNRNFESFSNVDVTLKKRYDLIPNLENIVKGYTEHEEITLEKITEIRESLSKKMTVSDRQKQEDKYSAVMKDVLAIAEKYPDLKVRVNTIGLANLIYEKDITKELKGRVDTVSISLNAPTKEEFYELTRSKFGIESFDAVKEFAVLSKKYVPNVVMTVVEKVMPEEKISICKKICDDLGVTLRIRPFEE